MLCRCEGNRDTVVSLIVAPQENTPPERERVAEMLRDFYLRSHRVIDRMMTAKGASYSKVRILMLIAREGPLRSVDIASSFGYAPRTITEAIDGLEKDGLVRRTPDPVDRRAKQISITQSGLSVIEGAEETKQSYIDTVFGVLDSIECDEIIRLIGKVNTKLDSLSH